MRRINLFFIALFCFACASDATVRKIGILTVAVAGDIVLIGRAQTFGTDGTFRMVSLEQDPIECTGRFRYSNPPNGRARFSCTNGETGTIRIEAESPLRGTGSGSSTFGRVEIAFGFSIRELNRRLNFPDGKILKIHNQGILLESPNAK